MLKELNFGNNLEFTECAVICVQNKCGRYWKMDLNGQNNSTVQSSQKFQEKAISEVSYWSSSWVIDGVIKLLKDLWSHEVIEV